MAGNGTAHGTNPLRPNEHHMSKPVCIFTYHSGHAVSRVWARRSAPAALTAPLDSGSRHLLA